MVAGAVLNISSLKWLYKWKFKGDKSGLCRVHKRVEINWSTKNNWRNCMVSPVVCGCALSCCNKALTSLCSRRVMKSLMTSLYASTIICQDMAHHTPTFSGWRHAFQYIWCFVDGRHSIIIMYWCNHSNETMPRRSRKHNQECHDNCEQNYKPNDWSVVFYQHQAVSVLERCECDIEILFLT